MLTAGAFDPGEKESLFCDTVTWPASDLGNADKNRECVDSVELLSSYVGAVPVREDTLELSWISSTMMAICLSDAAWKAAVSSMGVDKFVPWAALL